MMLVPPIPSDEISRRGKAWYEKLRPLVETPQNIGKEMVINVQTGEYEIDESGSDATDRLFDKDPFAALYGVRIGYTTVYSLSGALIRTTPLP